LVVEVEADGVVLRLPASTCITGSQRTEFDIAYAVFLKI
jgi:hypothetical protein